MQGLSLAAKTFLTSWGSRKEGFLRFKDYLSNSLIHSPIVTFWNSKHINILTSRITKDTLIWINSNFIWGNAIWNSAKIKTANMVNIAVTRKWLYTGKHYWGGGNYRGSCLCVFQSHIIQILKGYFQLLNMGYIPKLDGTFRCTVEFHPFIVADWTDNSIARQWILR